MPLAPLVLNPIRDSVCRRSSACSLVYVQHRTRMRVLLLGDTHGNTGWVRDVALPIAYSVSADAVFQLGDFGYWDTDGEFVNTVSKSNTPFYFIDGNHENHPKLPVEHGEVVNLSGNLYYVPRGSVLNWEGVKVLAVGGAHSIDRAYRTPGVDWFPEEDISEDDVRLAVSALTCDIMLCHDAPSTAELPLVTPYDVAWRAELPACEANRERVGFIVDAVKPSLYVHGHYHSKWDFVVQRPWGKYRIVGLDCDGSDISDNMTVLECEDGRWSITPLSL